MFCLVAMDDQDNNTEIVLNYARAAGFTNDYMRLSEAKTVDSCLANLDSAQALENEWLFVLDCDMTRDTSSSAGGTSFGGFTAWARVTERLPKPFFGIVYSHSVEPIIAAVRGVGPKSWAALSPKLYHRNPGDDGGMDTWCKDAISWMSRRQDQLIATIPLDSKISAYQALRNLVLGDGSAAVTQMSELVVPIDGCSWPVAHLFPLEACRVKRSVATGDAIWQQEILGITARLLPCLSVVVHDLAYFLTADLSSCGIDAIEQTIWGYVHSKLDHVYESNGFHRFSAGTAAAFTSEKLSDYCRRLTRIAGLWPAFVDVARDPLLAALSSVSTCTDPGSIRDVILSITQYPKGAFWELPPWTDAEGAQPVIRINDARSISRKTGLISTVCSAIRDVINAQAVRYGDLSEAQHCGTGEDEAFLYCLFRTQVQDGCVLNVDRVKERCQSAEVVQGQLTALVEIVCRQYGGEVALIQGPHASRSDACFPKDTLTLHLTPNECRAERHSKWPRGLGILEQYANFVENKDGYPKLQGTYYALKFPLWTER